MRNNILTDTELNNLAKVCDVLEHFDKAGEFFLGKNTRRVRWLNNKKSSLEK